MKQVLNFNVGTSESGAKEHLTMQTFDTCTEFL